MAVFYVNVCTYPNCNKDFQNLSDLICHIEDVHLDFHPAVLEEMERQKPLNVPLSYVLKFSQTCENPVPVDDTNSVNSKENNLNITKGHFPLLDGIKADGNPTSTRSPSNGNLWNKHPNTENLTHTKTTSVHKRGETKKFTCPVPGCNKKYKNINGIKYHKKNGHDMEMSYPSSKKIYPCHCGKIYRTAQGLKAHYNVHKNIHVNMQQSHSLMLSGLKSSLDSHFELKLEYTDASDILKTENADDILNSLFLNQIPKLSDTIDRNNNLLIPLNSLHNHSIFNDDFVDDLSFEEANSNHYSFPFSYQKYL